MRSINGGSYLQKIYAIVPNSEFNVTWSSERFFQINPKLSKIERHLIRETASARVSFLHSLLASTILAENDFQVLGPDGLLQDRHLVRPSSFEDESIRFGVTRHHRLSQTEIGGEDHATGIAVVGIDCEQNTGRLRLDHLLDYHCHSCRKTHNGSYMQ